MKRPQFSVRTLSIVVTIVCAYLASWEVTKRHASDESPPTIASGDIVHASSPVPFLIVRDLQSYESGGLSFPREYCVWLFGRGKTLPIESSWKQPWKYPWLRTPRFNLT